MKYLKLLLLFCVVIFSSFIVYSDIKDGCTVSYDFENLNGNIINNTASSSNDNKGYLINDANVITSGNGKALFLDGTDDYVLLNDTNNVFDFLDNNWTVSWNEYRNISDDGSIVYNREDDTFSPLILSYDGGGNDNKLYSGNVDNNGWNINGDIIGTNNVSIWNNYVVISDNRTIRAYKNGVYTGYNTSHSLRLEDLSTNALLGKWSTNYFKGLIDNFNIWNRTLTDSEITQVANNWTYNSIVIYPIINFTIPTSNNGITVNRNYFEINTTMTGENLNTPDIYIYNSSLDSYFSINASYYNITNLTNGIYYYDVVVYDVLGHMNETELRNITINYSVSVPDNSTPQIYFIGDSGTVNRDYIIEKIVTNAYSFKNLSVIFYNSTEILDSYFSAINSNYTLNMTSLEDGVYYINATVNDNNGNYNRTSRNVMVNTSYVVPTVVNNTLASVCILIAILLLVMCLFMPSLMLYIGMALLIDIIVLVLSLI